MHSTRRESTRTHAAPRRSAFTLIELLVVIAIISLLVGLSFTYVRGMLRSSQEQMAANSISNAVQAARAYATRYVPFVDSFQGRTSETNGDGYSGAAVIFTPANELRISENDEAAEESGGRRLELPPLGTAIYNGYRPIQDLDDLLLPKGVSVLGLVRTGEDTIELLPPPFAVSFSRRGDLITQAVDPSEITTLRNFRRADGFVYYDGDGDGVWDTSNDRDDFVNNGDDDGNQTLDAYRRGGAENITPDDFRTRTLSIPENRDPEARGFMEGRRKLPFEKIEPVVGIVIFQTDRVPARFSIFSDDPADVNADGTGPNNTDQFHPQRAAGITIDLTEDDNLLAWAASSAGGTVLFFNRRTGAELRR